MAVISRAPGPDSPGPSPSPSPGPAVLRRLPVRLRRDGTSCTRNDPRRRPPDPVRPPQRAPSPTNSSSGRSRGPATVLTVEETAPHLRVSRSTAYKLVHEYTATGGSAGLPHVRLVGRILIRRVDLAAILGLPPRG